MAPIVLAHEEPFRLGGIEVKPAIRSVSANGKHEIVEPRVMQVLVALARADGTVLSREDLIAMCWEGRIVGDDAINRVMSRLRRIGDGIGKRSFVVETVTRVGYRLRLAGDVPTDAGPRVRLSRRGLIGGGVGAAALAAVGIAVLAGRDPSLDNPPDPKIDALMRQALLADRQASREGQNQAIALYRRVVEIDPNYADGWGALGVAYASASHYRPTGESQALGALAVAAGKRAQTIDPGNGLGQVAVATSRPTMGNWRAVERSLRRAIARDPRSEAMFFALAGILTAVGRNGEAVPLFEQIERLSQPTPQCLYWHIQALWRSGRMEETDALIARAITLYPTHFAIWFSKFYISMFSGRIDAAIAMGRDQSGRPTGIPSDEFDDILAMAEALRSREPQAIDAVIAVQRERARAAAGRAENAIQFAAALGRIDEAFEFLNAYYFGRPFVVPEVRFTVEQGSYTPRDDRATFFLFNPPLAEMRADPRFEALVSRLGMRRYWRESLTLPDYLRKG